MWKVFNNDIEIGTYDTLLQVNEIVQHEIYLYNCDAKEGIAGSAPKFRIEGDFEN